VLPPKMGSMRKELEDLEAWARRSEKSVDVR